MFAITYYWIPNVDHVGLYEGVYRKSVPVGAATKMMFNAEQTELVCIFFCSECGSVVASFLYDEFNTTECHFGFAIESTQWV